ncbi:hypothetical protein RHGRI_022557 [Rhododendron griersonianum]|uniref:AT-hook motif nuclear-localized protein n=1 Tax=Rhododendron griersonianum TaxID=479676 RepID=A0AAV6J215_9ERIC|nr:hypothetical protein RHGRI_022557 [Rhododendron griersonianum]
METYGTVTGSDGGGGGGTTGVVQNNNMNLSFATADGAAVYKPVIQPSSAPATPTQAYQAGGSGNGSTVAASIATATTAGEQTKRKRGRPRKYPVDGTVTPRLAPPPQPRAEAALLSPAPLAVVAPTSGPGKKSRGRPRGSGNKIKQHGNRQHVAPLVSQGFPYESSGNIVLQVQGGHQGLGLRHMSSQLRLERWSSISQFSSADVSSKIMSFSQSGSQAISILSANGTISNVTLRQAATLGGSVTYEGRFEILSLSGSYMVSESGGQRSRTGGLSVLLAGPDGRVLGGGVAGLLTAAAPVQVVIGCFLPGQELKPPIQAEPLAAAPPRLNHGASAAGSPASRGTLSESSGGGPGSPLNQSTGAYNNNNAQSMTAFSWK